MQLFLLCFILAMTVESLDPSDGLIEWVWMGGLSPASISFRVGLKQDLPFDYTEMINDIYLKVHSLTNPKAHKMNFATSEQSTKDVIIFDVVGLFEGHDFEYSIHLGRNILKTGTFQTPSTAPLDFTIAFSSCMDQQSDPKVFETIASHKPLLFFHLGDLHYDNIAQDDEELFKNGYLSTFRSPSGKAMLDMNIPTVYMWDDHDFGPDNSDSMAPGRRAAIKTYKEFVPHYELDRSKANVQDDEKRTGGSVHQSFQIGTVLFILTDLRSQRTPNSASDSSNKTVLGPHQKQMFKDLILKSLEASSTVQCIVWCNTMPWVDDERKWGHFKTEQQELVDFFNQHQVLKHKRFFIISGDAHMIAVDDGTNSPGNIPVFHSAALGREGSVKGGPYSHGAFPGSGHFGLLHFTWDIDRDETCVKFSGRDINDEIVQEYDLCHPEAYPSNPFIPPPIIVRKIKRTLKKMRKRLDLKSDLALYGAMAILMVILTRVVRRASVRREDKHKTQ